MHAQRIKKRKKHLMISSSVLQSSVVCECIHFMHAWCLVVAVDWAREIGLGLGNKGHIAPFGH